MSISHRMIRGVIFDMDGVLCDSEAMMSEAACRMFTETYGVTPTHEDFVPFMGRGEDRYLGGVAARYGVALVMPRDKERAYQIYLDIIPGRLQPLPGVHAFIDHLRARGLPLAVATGADRIKMIGNLRELHLPESHFVACITGNDIVKPKPDPEIFLRAAAALSLPPGDCLVLEDSLSGVKAAHAAGARCLGVASTLPPERLATVNPDWMVRDLREGLARIDDILGGARAD